MSELSEFDIAAAAPEPPHRYERERSPLIWVGVVVALLAVGAGLYFWLRNDPGDIGTTATDTQVAPATPPPGDAAEPLDVPPLDQSDAFVKKLVAALSSHPMIGRWLTTDGLIRNFAVVVENIAYGMLPTGHLRPLRPSGMFRVLERDGELAIDPRTYARYDGIAGAVASVDTAGAAKLYAGLKPRLQEAYAELGRDEPFDAVMERAIVILLRVPEPPDSVALEPAGAVEYKYADEELEALTQPQKQLLRMGPRNIEIIQGKLRDLALAIGIPDARLP
jgi:hypothetical protein